jgi:two-component system, NarL family, response regulator YdfI
MIHVLVEASSPDLHAEIADLLRDHSQIRVIENPIDAAVGESHRQPDVVLVAVEAQGEGAFESFTWNAGGWNSAGVPIILLVENPGHRISETVPAGVRAVLPRNVTPAEIVGAIEAVVAGLYVFHPSDVDSISTLRPREADTAPEFGEQLVERLTPREIEVLQLLSEGLGNKEIAARLNISEHTAKFHVASIMGKLGATSRTEAVTLGIRHGFVMI